MEQKDYDKEIALLKAKITELEKVKVAEKKNNPFDVNFYDKAYYNFSCYTVSSGDTWDKEETIIVIPCKDKDIVIARQKRHKLNDLLEKFAYDNDAVVTDEMWKDCFMRKWCIYKNDSDSKYNTDSNTWHHLDLIYFTTQGIAQRAITEVIEPFNEGRL